MDIALNIGWIILGLVALYFGAEWLVKGAVGIALKAGISSLVVGLTIVAFGTSTPELIVSIQANLNGNGDFALGNVIGSNICNLGLVLGVAAVMSPVQVHVQFIKRELPLLVVVSLIFVGMLLLNDQIDRVEGLILASGVLVYTFVCIKIASNNPDDPIASVEEEVASEESAGESNKTIRNVFLLIVGLALLSVGANRLVAGAEAVAKAIGVSDAVISLTVVAFGTSLPELATTIVACLKGESEMAAGNAVGSCLFNLLCVAGFTALIKPILSTDISVTDLSVMVAFSLATYLLMRQERTLSRLDGILLLAGYAIYIVLAI